ncbi:hypothetical protein Trisim1_009857 [Trichoderma cf. simile WF8]
MGIAARAPSHVNDRDHGRDMHFVFQQKKKRPVKNEAKKETYNSRCSLMVTHSTTNLPLIGLTLGEQTGPRIFQWIWSYVLEVLHKPPYMERYVGLTPLRKDWAVCVKIVTSNLITGSTGT